MYIYYTNRYWLLNLKENQSPITIEISTKEYLAMIVPTFLEEKFMSRKKIFSNLPLPKKARDTKKEINRAERRAKIKRTTWPGFVQIGLTTRYSQLFEENKSV